MVCDQDMKSWGKACQWEFADFQSVGTLTLVWHLIIVSEKQNMAVTKETDPVNDVTQGILTEKFISESPSPESPSCHEFSLEKSLPKISLSQPFLMSG